MKSLLISTVAVLLVACSTAKVEQKADTKDDVVESSILLAIPAAAPEMDISHFYPGPSFLMVLKKKAEIFKFTDAQKLTFDERRVATQPKVMKLVKALGALEKEIKLLSIQKKPSADILAKGIQALALRKEIAALKSECHTFVKATLDEGQWNQLVEIYRTESVFNERTQKGERIAHINPVPNYMKAITRGDVTTLTPAQKESFATWSKTNGPKIVELGAKIIELEKSIYETSLAGDESSVPGLVDEIGAARTEILVLKTTCRDYLIAQLDDVQWATVVGATTAQ